MADELLEQLLAIQARISEHDEQGTELRTQRRTILQQLTQQPGWSLEKIGRAVGRSKQAVSQWLR